MIWLASVFFKRQVPLYYVYSCYILFFLNHIIPYIPLQDTISLIILFFSFYLIKCNYKRYTQSWILFVFTNKWHNTLLYTNILNIILYNWTFALCVRNVHNKPLAQLDSKHTSLKAVNNMFALLGILISCLGTDHLLIYSHRLIKSVQYKEANKVHWKISAERKYSVCYDVTQETK